MSEIKWIKITTDMFDNRKIKYLRRLPDGNNIVLIWIMLLTMAGRCNAGGMVFLTENIPYRPEDLANELDFDLNTVRLALEALQKLNMICCDGDMFAISGWEEYQNIDGMDKIREQNRLRKSKQREREKALMQSCDSHVTVTQCHATDIEEEIDKELDITLIKSNRGATRTKHPSVEEVAAYCKERNNGIDPQHFFDYYTQQGWKLANGRAMADWKACVRTWEHRDKSKPQKAPAPNSVRDIPSVKAKEDMERNKRLLERMKEL